MFPFTYRKLFSETGTKIIISITWFLATCHAAVGFLGKLNLLVIIKYPNLQFKIHVTFYSTLMRTFGISPKVRAAISSRFT